MARNLVVCCDGTWNTPKQKDNGVSSPTNVYRLSQEVVEDATQRVRYFDGVGTDSGMDKWTGGMFGIGLTENIKKVYRWLADEYQDNDRIFLFGFSRGAYTVRSLGGLLGRCGLTPKGGRKADDDAYNLYREASPKKPAAQARAEAFKNQPSQRRPDIHMIGVWDTVGSLGVPAFSRYGLLRKTVLLLTDGSKYAHGFHDETLGMHVKHAYHALALDERRGPFMPSLWKAGKRGNDNVEQVWFAGVHSNVGGGYADAGLSNQAFAWMALKATNAGLKLKPDYEDRHRANYHGEMRDEFEGFYKLVPSYERRFGDNDIVGEKIHCSTLKRVACPTHRYQPRTLKEIQNIQQYVNEEAFCEVDPCSGR